MGSGRSRGRWDRRRRRRDRLGVQLGRRRTDRVVSSDALRLGSIHDREADTDRRRLVESLLTFRARDLPTTIGPPDVCSPVPVRRPLGGAEAGMAAVVCRGLAAHRGQRAISMVRTVWCHGSSTEHTAVRSRSSSCASQVDPERCSGPWRMSTWTAWPRPSAISTPVMTPACGYDSEIACRTRLLTSAVTTLSA